MLIPHNPIQASTAQGITQIGTFGFLQDRQMFDMLSNQLYTRKEEAAIREISCNAHDAHKDAGKDEMPIEVWAPTAKEPYFKVRDYGHGMSYEMLTKQYPTYGWSDKRDDVVKIGGFGLGAKAPLAYLANFEDGLARPFLVESIHMGIRNVILCAYDTHGMPGLHEVVRDEPTEDRSGVTVSFEVDPQHIPRFIAALEHVFLAFTVQPTIHNHVLPERKLGPSHKGIGYVQHGVSTSDYQTGPSLTLANVTYPVRNLTPKNPLLSPWLVRGMNLSVASGPRIMAPSREALMETKLTRQTLEDWYLKEIAGAYLAAFECVTAITEPQNYSSKSLGDARNALKEANLHGLPFSANGFKEFCGASEVVAQLVSLIASSSEITLQLPEFLLERTSGLVLVHPYYHDGKATSPKVRKLSPSGTYEDKSTEKSRRRSRETKVLPFKFRVMALGATQVLSPEIVIMQTGSAGRRIQSELLRRSGGKGIPTSMLGMRVRPKEMGAAMALIEQLKQVPGYGELKVTLSNDIELSPAFTKQCDKPKEKSKVSATPRIPGEVMYVPGYAADSASSWQLSRVRLINGEEGLDSGAIRCYVDAKGASWRGGSASSFSGTNLVEIKELSKEPMLVRLNAVSEQFPEIQTLASYYPDGIPGAVLVTNQKLAAAVKSQGLPSLSEYLIKSAIAEIQAYPADIRSIAGTFAALKVAGSNGYSERNTEWTTQFRDSSEACKALLKQVTNREAKAHLKAALPGFFKPGLSYETPELYRLIGLMENLSRFFRRHAYSEAVHTRIFDGKLLRHVSELLNPLHAFARAMPHVPELYNSVGAVSGISKRELLVMALNYRKAANDTTQVSYG